MLPIFQILFDYWNHNLFSAIQSRHVANKKSKIILPYFRSVETCARVGEMKAHNSTINTVAVNNSHIFTGSNDGSVGMWRIRNNYDRSPESESSWHRQSQGPGSPRIGGWWGASSSMASSAYHLTPPSSVHGSPARTASSTLVTGSLGRLSPGFSGNYWN